MGAAPALFEGMRFAFVLAFAALSGCDTEGDKVALANLGDGGTAVAAVEPIASGAVSSVSRPAAISADENAKLRRKYDHADMKYNPCVKREETTVKGRGCSSGIMVFGPYVNVPGDSEVELTMDIQSPSAINVHSDMGSQVGKRSLGGISPQTLAPNEKRRIGYKINMAQADTAVETRIWVHGTGPVDFDITNLIVQVR
jgi:hypothetical protein